MALKSLNSIIYLSVWIYTIFFVNKNDGINLNYFLLLNALEIINTIITIIKTVTNIPTPIPVLKIPPITAHPENVVRSAIINP